MWSNIRILVVCACAVTAQVADWDDVNDELGDIESRAGLADQINKTIDSIRPKLETILIENFPFKTGDQEFGNLNGRLYELNVTGVSELVATVINVNIVPIAVKNLTIEIPTISVRGKYLFDGQLSFPLGEGDIHFYGDGALEVEVIDTVISLKFRVGVDGGHYVAKDFDIFLTFGDVKAHLTNLMGGGDMEDIFNDLINDVALAIVDYYKDPLLEAAKPLFIQAINALLDKINGGGSNPMI